MTQPILGRRIEYVQFEPDAAKSNRQKTGRVIYAGKYWLVEVDSTGEVDVINPTQSDVRFTEVGHPAGLRPVAYQWGGRTAEYREGWLVGISGDPDASIVIVETRDGQILELDTPSVRFMDRGQGLPAADSVPLALSV